MIDRIFPEGSPKPRGPYSPAVRCGDFVFVSGQGPIDPATDKMRFGTIQEETRQVLMNVQRILAAAGCSLTDVVKCSVFLKDVRDFQAMNSVYAEFFGEQKPARTTVQALLPDPEMKVEIDCVAYKPKA
jgi:2-iminobutanoate/2-iminopropanoate deaminase